MAKKAPREQDVILAGLAAGHADQGSLEVCPRMCCQQQVMLPHLQDVLGYIHAFHRPPAGDDQVDRILFDGFCDSVWNRRTVGLHLNGGHAAAQLFARIL